MNLLRTSITLLYSRIMIALILLKDMDIKNPNLNELEGDITMNIEEIPYNIKFFREQNKWTQQELAEQLKVSRSVIAKWENNHVTPDISSLLKLCKVFDITLDHIVGIYSFREDLLKDFKRIYSSKSKSFDEDVVELVEYIMTHPIFKEQIYRLRNLSIKKQLSLHTLLSDMIDQYEQL